MKYVVKEPVLTTVSDAEISNDVEIRELLVGFKQSQQSVAMEFHDVDFPESVKILDNVRVIEVNEKTFNIHAFFNQSSAKYKNVPFGNIRKISVITAKSMIAKKYKVSRWHLLDVADLDN